jgi:HSP20 family protein
MHIALSWLKAKTKNKKDRKKSKEEQIMTLVRWRPNRSWLGSRHVVDRFFDDFFTNSFESDTVWHPNIDIVEKDDKLLTTVELPGINKEDVSISIENNVLSIEGTKKHEKEEKKEQYYRNERSFGSFKRSFKLPYPVDAKKIKANFKNGLVKIEIPKSPEAKAKEIPISFE